MPLGCTAKASGSPPDTNSRRILSETGSSTLILFSLLTATYSSLPSGDRPSPRGWSPTATVVSSSSVSLLMTEIVLSRSLLTKMRPVPAAWAEWTKTDTIRHSVRNNCMVITPQTSPLRSGQMMILDNAGRFNNQASGKSHCACTTSIRRILSLKYNLSVLEIQSFGCAYNKLFLVAIDKSVVSSRLNGTLIQLEPPLQ